MLLYDNGGLRQYLELLICYKITLHVVSQLTTLSTKLTLGILRTS